MKLDDVVGKYIKLRDLKAQMKKDYEEKVKPVTDAMDQIEAALLATFDKIGTDSVKSGAGTAYISTRTSATVVDKVAFRDFILTDPDNWALADLRAAKSGIEQFVDQHQDLPPGINWTAERTVNVRRA